MRINPINHCLYDWVVFPEHGPHWPILLSTGVWPPMGLLISPRPRPPVGSPPTHYVYSSRGYMSAHDHYSKRDPDYYGVLDWFLSCQLTPSSAWKWGQYTGVNLDQRTVWTVHKIWSSLNCDICFDKLESINGCFRMILFCVKFIWSVYYMLSISLVTDVLFMRNMGLEVATLAEVAWFAWRVSMPCAQPICPIHRPDTEVWLPPCVSRQQQYSAI